MGLSQQFLDGHIAEWETRLSGSAYRHRALWPRHLFHHAPIENAILILKSGELLSRVDSDQRRVRDVAAAGVIETSHRAHRFARLYFRPRTPTQFHIEGIRKLSDCQYGEDVHAPVLIMLVFDAREVLSMSEIYFSDANMQTGAIEQSTEEFFRSIPFVKVYHEGGIGGDRSIISHRCAEVLAPSPMSIQGKLRSIYCRSEAERVTLLQALGRAAPRYENSVRVSDDLKVFQKRFAFVDSVSLANNGVIFRLNQREDLKPVDLSLQVWDDRDRQLISYKNAEFIAKATNGRAWQLKFEFQPGHYRVAISLEGHLAYDAALRIEDVPF